MKKKVIIFDFDGTFYSGEQAFLKLENFIKENRRKFMPRLREEEYKKIVNENPLWEKEYNGSEIVDLMYALKEKYPQFDISVKDFWNWQNSTPDPLVIDKNLLVDNNYLNDICQKYPVYIVSNSSPTHIYYYMEMFGIDKNWFKEIISNRFTAKDRTKKHYYKRILEKENCKPQNAIVLGDSDKNDLEPARKLNINTCLITDSRTIPEKLNPFLNK
ncbi:MAG: HAD family hydrolase [Clostridia bacterium]|nr:HAD family hydrolase [Clostridia bacterium]